MQFYYQIRDYYYLDKLSSKERDYRTIHWIETVAESGLISGNLILQVVQVNGVVCKGSPILQLRVKLKLYNIPILYRYRYCNACL